MLLFLVMTKRDFHANLERTCGRVPQAGGPGGGTRVGVREQWQAVRLKRLVVEELLLPSARLVSSIHELILRPIDGV